eukprot:CAMPEP_0118967964 /NCGR_PEP_ID=MMETSP1173-20130426/5279_1 /TAXON_ID=1034831 /ORGANISM="Rhizochromulina marina cf, Strain CCMP1243" /LENGTH=43 /DNA_ID= /DNA_START= /DNA_END= /DNA_ORIENTATION=
MAVQGTVTIREPMLRQLSSQQLTPALRDDCEGATSFAAWLFGW